jgi:hypothetical protein
MNDKQNGHLDTNPQPLYVTLILDETGSMNSCKGAAIAGFNQYVATLRREPAETRFTLTLFNSRKTEVRYRGVPVSAVQDLDVETYRPNHTTPLYDAIGRTLTAARHEAPAGAKKLCVILSDGLENASQEYTRKQIFDLIKACEQEGWTVLYLGADHDVWAAGESLGIAGDNTVSFCKSNIGPIFGRLSETTARYRRGDSRPRQAPLRSNGMAGSEEEQRSNDGSSSHVN